MESWTLEKTHAEAIDRAAFVVVALLVLVLRATLDNGFGWLADAFITMTKVCLATSFAILGTIAAPPVRRAAGSAFVFHGITIPAVVLASTHLATRIVLGEEHLVVLDSTD